MSYKPSSVYLYIIAMMCFAVSAPSGLSARDLHSTPYWAHVYADSLVLRETDDLPLVLEGGDVSLLFIGESSGMGSLCSGLASRLDCSFSAIFTHSRGQLADPAQNLVTDSDVVALLNERLATEWDVILLGFDPSLLPPGAAERIRERLAAGAGMIYIGEKDDLELWDVRDADDDQLSVIRFRGLDVPDARRLDDGSVIVVSSLAQSAERSLREDYLFQAMNAVLVASGRVEDLHLRREIRQPRSLEFEGMHFQSFRIDLKHDADDEPMTVRCRYRSMDGLVVKKTTDRFTVKGGKTFLMIDYPILPIGEYSVEVMIERKSGISVMAGGAFTVESEDFVKSVVLWEPYIDENDIIGGMVHFCDEVDEAWAVELSLVDGYGRVLAIQKPVLEHKLKSVSFTFMSRYVTGGIAYVKTKFFKSRELLQVLETPVVIKRPYDPERFTFAVSLDPKDSPMRSTALHSLEHVGVNALGVSYEGAGAADAFEDARSVACINARIIPEMNNHIYNNDGRSARSFISIVDTLRHTGTLAALVDPPSFDMSSGEAFGEYLASRYNDVGALNVAWGTAYEGFDGIMENRSAESVMRRLDESLFRLSRLFQAQKAVHDRIGFSAPGLGVAMNGYPADIQGEPAFNAFRWKSVLSSVITDDPFPCAAFQILGSKGLNCFIARGNEPVPVLAATPWRAFFGGMNGVYWLSSNENDLTPWTPSFAPSPYLDIVARETNEIQNGIDTLLSAADRITDTSVGILMDPLANAGVGVDGEPGNYREARAFLVACADLAITPAFVPEERLGADWPVGNDGVLFVPGSVVMAERTVQKIAGFVEAGGTAIIDGRTALYDERLEERAAGGLDTLAGIERRSDASVLKTGVLDMVSDGLVTLDGDDVTAYDGGLSFGDTVDVIVGAGEDPVIVRNACGEGFVYVVTADFSDYPVARLEGGRQWLPDLIGSMAGRIAVLERGFGLNCVLSGKRIPFSESAIYRDGDIWYFGCVLDPALPKTTAEAEITVEGVGTTYAVYDVRARDFVGVTNSFSVPAEAGKGYLFAFLPYRVRKLELSIDRAIVKAGKQIGFRAGVVLVNDSLPVARHVFRVELFGPDGEPRPSFERIVEVEGGVLNDDLAFALNDDHGRWTVRATDVATGRKAERSFMLMPPDVPVQ